MKAHYFPPGSGVSACAKLPVEGTIDADFSKDGDNDQRCGLCMKYVTQMIEERRSHGLVS